MQYTIVSAADEKTLEARVNEAMAKGWTPFGGLGVSLIVSNGKRLYIFAQAMTKPKS